MEIVVLLVTSLPAGEVAPRHSTMIIQDPLNFIIPVADVMCELTSLSRAVVVALPSSDEYTA